MRFKKFVCALAAALFCLALPVTAYAEEGITDSYAEEVVPMYDDYLNTNALITFSGSSASCRCSASDSSSVVASISVVMTLQKSGLLGIYTDVKDASWSKSVNGSSISLSGSKSGLSDGTYRVKAVFTVTTKDGGTSTFTKYSSTAKTSGT
ncbi:MAG: hypothetical protein K2O14_04765 [Oscillospiraceae bacterium]|nr:hypothetical protein [Oscillospiraceae bacterium]